MELHNYELASWCRRCRRHAEEIHLSASADGPKMYEQDKDNIRSYILSLRALRDHIDDQPEVPYPETKDQTYTVEDLQDFVLIENESINDLAHAFVQMFNEVSQSQSAKMVTGILEFDFDNMETWLLKVESLLENYVEVATPLNLAQSSPKRERTAPGRRGVKKASN